MHGHGQAVLLYLTFDIYGKDYISCPTTDAPLRLKKCFLIIRNEVLSTYMSWAARGTWAGELGGGGPVSNSLSSTRTPPPGLRSATPQRSSPTPAPQALRSFVVSTLSGDRTYMILEWSSVAP